MVKIHLREIREKQNLSMRALEEISGVSHSQIERIENGSTSPTLKVLYKLSKALCVPITALFDCEE